MTFYSPVKAAEEVGSADMVQMNFVAEGECAVFSKEAENLDWYSYPT